MMPAIVIAVLMSAVVSTRDSLVSYVDTRSYISLPQTNGDKHFRTQKATRE